MRSILKVLLALILVVVLSVGGLLAMTFHGLAPTEARELPGVGWVAFDGYAGFSILDAGNGQVVLIDAGNDKSGNPVLDALTAHQHKADDVVAVFLTHGHPDHIAAIPHLPNAKVYGLAAEEPYLEGKLPWRGPLPRMFGAFDSGVRIRQTLDDGSVTHIGTVDVETFAVPGHTAGSAVYLIRGALFLGDSATIEKDGALRPAPWIFSDDTAENRRSLVALADRLRPRAAEIKWLVPAHSGVGEGADALLAYKN